MGKKKKPVKAEPSNATPKRAQAGKAQPKKPTAAPKKTRREIEEEMEKKHKRTTLFVLIFAIVAVVAIVVAIIAVAVGNAVNSETADFINGDMSQYVNVPENAYKGFEVDLSTIDKVTDLSVKQAVLKALCEHSEADPTYGSSIYVNLPRAIGIGDVVYIYYRGYTVDENGVEHDFSGGCNFAGGLDDLEIGSGSFIPGFELALVGKKPSQYSKLEIIEDGTVKKGDLVSFTYSVIRPESESEEDVTVLVVADPEVSDEIYGEGFTEKMIIGKEIGKLSGNFEVYNLGEESGKTIFTDMEINGIFNGGDNPLTIDVVFPKSYDEESLRGVAAKFDVYVEKAQLNTVPEIDEKFITEKLKLDIEKIKSYEGESIEDKYSAYVKETLEEQYDEQITAAVESAFWKSILSKCEVKRYPMGDVNAYYYSELSKVKAYYESNSSSFSSLDECAITYYDLDKNDDWREYVINDSKEVLKQKLAFYFVAQKENLLPKDEEYQKIYEATVDEYFVYFLEQVGCEREDYNSDKEFEAAKAEYRKTMINYYGEEFFRENAYFKNAMKTIETYASFKE